MESSQVPSSPSSQDDSSPPSTTCSPWPSQRDPARLSALYQYHNAPEVAPAHGLEYDDTIYPSSDKYPVIREAPYRAKHKSGRYGFGSDDNRPPRIIFGMKVPTFLMVAAVMVLIIVGAAVGGAVGGAQLRENQSQAQHSLTSNATSSTTTPTSTFSAAVPTYTPLSDCPGSNNTTYISSFAQNTTSTKGLDFTKFCDRSAPYDAEKIAEAFVYSFSDCVEVCAGYNFYNQGTNCTFASYQPTGHRPGNCMIGHALDTGSFNETQGTDVAILNL